jgi:hypothetical protein
VWLFVRALCLSLRSDVGAGVSVPFLIHSMPFMIYTVIPPQLHECSDPVNSLKKAPIESIPYSLDTQPEWKVLERGS